MHCHSRAICAMQRNLHYECYLKNEVVTNCISLYNETLLNKCLWTKSIEKQAKKRRYQEKSQDSSCCSSEKLRGRKWKSCPQIQVLILVLGLVYMSHRRPYRVQVPRIRGRYNPAGFAASAFLDGYIIQMRVSAHHWGQDSQRLYSALPRGSETYWNL